MSRSGLFSDFLRGMYSGRIVKIYGRRVTTLNRVRKGREYIEYKITLPTKWVRESGVPKEVILLETSTGELIILHPETVEEVGSALEGIVKANKARIEVSKKVKESLLWKIYKKYRGSWKAADRRRKTPPEEKKDKKDNWRDKVTIGW